MTFSSTASYNINAQFTTNPTGNNIKLTAPTAVCLFSDFHFNPILAFSLAAPIPIHSFVLIPGNIVGHLNWNNNLQTGIGIFLTNLSGVDV